MAHMDRFEWDPPGRSGLCERYPVAERLARRGFYVPSGLGLTGADAERVAAALADLLG